MKNTAPPEPLARDPQRLSLERIEAASASIDPAFLNSPQFVCEPLAELLEVRLVAKVATLNPIRSFKGRGAPRTGV
jgi:threonine dehydratase